MPSRMAGSFAQHFSQSAQRVALHMGTPLSWRFARMSVRILCSCGHACDTLVLPPLWRQISIILGGLRHPDEDGSFPFSSSVHNGASEDEAFFEAAAIWPAVGEQPAMHDVLAFIHGPTFVSHAISRNAVAEPAPFGA